MIVHKNSNQSQALKLVCYFFFTLSLLTTAGKCAICVCLYLHFAKTIVVICDHKSVITRDLRSFVIRFDFESYVRFEIRYVVMVRFEIFESSALSIVIRKETIGGG